MAELYIRRCPFYPKNVSHRAHDWLDESEPADPKHTWCYGKSEPLPRRCSATALNAHAAHDWWTLGATRTEHFHCDGEHVLTTLARHQSQGDAA